MQNVIYCAYDRHYKKIAEGTDQQLSNMFNADKDIDGVIEFENKKYDTKDIVMIKHTGPYQLYAGKTKNFL